MTFLRPSVAVGRLTPGLVSTSASVPGDLVANLARIVSLLGFRLGHRLLRILDCNVAIVIAAFRSALSPRSTNWTRQGYNRATGGLELDRGSRCRDDGRWGEGDNGSTRLLDFDRTGLGGHCWCWRKELMCDRPHLDHRAYQ